MKIRFSILIFIFVVGVLSTASALTCYRCDPKKDCKDPIKQDDLLTQDCDKEVEPTKNFTSEATTKTEAATTGTTPTSASSEETTAEGLVERQVDDLIRIGSERGCGKAIGLNEKNETMTIRGCSNKQCTSLFFAMAINQTCHFCDKDKCNGSTRINPIGWIFLLINLIYISLD